jgi:hypothetical protein
MKGFKRVLQVLPPITGNILYIFIGAQFVLFAFLSVFIRTWIRPDAQISIGFDPVYTVLAVAGFAVFSLLFRAVLKTKPQGKNRLWALLPYILSFFLQLALMVFMPAPVEGGDAWQVRTIAVQIAEGNFQAFLPTHYLSQYPNNTGLALFYAFFFLFLPKSYYVIKALNLLFNLATMAAAVKLFDLIFPERRKYRRAFTFYMLFFMPAMLFVNYTYGDVPSGFFTTAAIYYAFKYARSKALPHCIAAAALVLFAYFLRQTALLVGLSIAVYWIYAFFFKNRVFRARTAAVIAAASLLLTFQLTAVDFVFRQFGCWDTPVERNAQPITRWINMGIPHDASYGYWDQGATTHDYYVLKGDKSKLNQQLLSDIGDSLRNTPPDRLAAGYLVKNYWMWSEGTFESIKYGVCATPKGEWFYRTGSSLMDAELSFLDFANTCIKAHYIFILFFSGVYFLLRKRGRDERLLFCLLILSFYCFYTVWEMKSRYLYPLYPVLLLISFDTAVRLFEKAHKAWQKRKRISAGAPGAP